MNCDEQVYSRKELIDFANLQAKESNIQLLQWVLKILATGSTFAMCQQVIRKKIDDLKLGEVSRLND